MGLERGSQTGTTNLTQAVCQARKPALRRHKLEAAGDAGTAANRSVIELEEAQAMKMKLSLKKLKFKELFVQHVEKAALGAAVVCLLIFVVSALQRETLPPEREPDKLVDQTTNAKNHVEKSDPKVALEGVRGPDAPVYAERVQREPVLLANYDIKVPFNGPIVDSRQKRDEPVYLTLTDLRVGTGFAPFAVINPNANQQNINRPRRRPGVVEEQPMEVERIVDRQDIGGVRVSRDSKLEVRYWAMVTALVPVRKQKEEYVKTFESAVNYDPEQDMPKYLGYQTERAEVSSGDMSNLKWEPVSIDREFVQEWNAEVQEPVMPEYVTDLFTMRLAPRVGADWEEYVGHLPEIPFELKRDAFGGMGPGDRRGGPMGLGDFEGGMPAGRGFGGEGGGEEEEEEAEMFDRGRVRRPTNVVEEDPDERRRKSEAVAMMGSSKTVKGVDHVLFRFCDFTVEPGKQYVYRVRLGLSNPNKGVAVKFLKRPELADPKPRVSEWSQPSPIAMIPYGDKILSGKVTPATVMKEPVGMFHVVQVKDDVGAEVPIAQEVSRGSIANFIGKKTEFINPIDKKVEEYQGDFVTESVVLDMRGGRPVLNRDKEMTEPGEMLILSRTGQLVAMNEFDDEDVWNMYVVPEEKKPVDGMMLEGQMPMGPPGLLGPGVGRGRKAPQENDVLGAPGTGQPVKKRVRTKSASK